MFTLVIHPSISFGYSSARIVSTIYIWMMTVGKCRFRDFAPSAEVHKNWSIWALSRQKLMQPFERSGNFTSDRTSYGDWCLRFCTLLLLQRWKSCRNRHCGRGVLFVFLLASEFYHPDTVFIRKSELNASFGTLGVMAKFRSKLVKLLDLCVANHRRLHPIFTSLCSGWFNSNLIQI